MATDRTPLPPLDRGSARPARGSTYDIRRASGLRLRERVVIQARRDELVHELADIDDRLLALSEERRALVEQLGGIRTQLYPPIPWCHGRRPPDLDVAPLPPVPAGAVPLTGRALRAACRQILRRHGATSLRELHALLHRYGYHLGSPRPVAALSDAMRHEVSAGRARRVARGVYELHVAVGQRPSRAARWLKLPAAEQIHRLRATGRTPLDPDLDDDPSSWGYRPPPDPPGPGWRAARGSS